MSAEFAPGNSTVERIRNVSTQVFTGDDNQRFQFTWRTIQTWYSRYKKDGVTTTTPRLRADRGLPRKVEPEQLLEAIEQVLPSFHKTPKNMTAVYRACIERGLLRREQVARTTFGRLIKQHELLKPEAEAKNKVRLAFAKAHAKPDASVVTANSFSPRRPRR